MFLLQFFSPEWRDKFTKIKAKPHRVTAIRISEPEKPLVLFWQWNPGHHHWIRFPGTALNAIKYSFFFCFALCPCQEAVQILYSRFLHLHIKWLPWIQAHTVQYDAIPFQNPFYSTFLRVRLLVTDCISSFASSLQIIWTEMYIVWISNQADQRSRLTLVWGSQTQLKKKDIHTVERLCV